MNLVLLEDADFVDAVTAVVRGRRARHIREVHRAAPADTLNVGRLDGLLGTGTVRLISDDEVVLEVALDRAPPASPGIELLLAMPRPKVLRRVLQSVTTLGVKRLVLVNAWRVEKSYFDSPQLSPEAIHEELVLGLEQARDTTLPVVELRKLFRPFVEEELPTRWPAQVPKLVADPRGATLVAQCRPGTSTEPCLVAIGPEGGWIAPELASLTAAGFQTFSLGPRILRVEVAVTLVLGQLELLRRRPRDH